MIEVERKNGNEFKVVVREDDGMTRHAVTVGDDYYQKLTGGEITKEELVERSFKFLLAREPKESILSRFDLPVIERYFPSYEDEISV